MNHFYHVRIFTLITFFISTNLLADPLVDAVANYKLGAYQTMINQLIKFEPRPQDLSTKFYLLGIAYNRLQDFENGGRALVKAIQLKNTSPDLWYELGQALYANSDLRKAREAFSRSAKSSYKEVESLYYVAHISQILEDYKTARDLYMKVSKHPGADTNLQQASMFQLSEVLLAMAEAREDSTRLVESYILPQFEKAQQTDPNSEVAKDISDRIREVKTRFGLDPNRLRNGRILPEKRWNLDFSQEFNFDNNVTFATDVPTQQATQKESFLLDSTLNMGYTSSFKGRYILEPTFRINQKKYTETSEPTVFQNDSYDITGGLLLKIEHLYKEQPATFGMGLDYKYIARDRLRQKERVFYARSVTLSFSETLRLNSYGDTTFRFKYKDYSAFQSSLNNTTKTFSADQTIILKNGTLLIALINADLIEVENERDSTNSYLFRVDHLRPNFFWGFTLSAGLGITLLDTKLQSDTRGTEKSYNPSFRLIKKLSQDLSMQLTYDYTKNTSLDEARYAYTKHVSGLRFRLKF